MASGDTPLNRSAVYTLASRNGTTRVLHRVKELFPDDFAVLYGIERDLVHLEALAARLVCHVVAKEHGKALVVRERAFATRAMHFVRSRPPFILSSHTLLSARCAILARRTTRLDADDVICIERIDSLEVLSLLAQVDEPCSDLFRGHDHYCGRACKVDR